MWRATLQAWWLKRGAEQWEKSSEERSGSGAAGGRVKGTPGGGGCVQDQNEPR